MRGHKLRRLPRIPEYRKTQDGYRTQRDLLREIFKMLFNLRKLESETYGLGIKNYL